jgi:hypothetical protein
MWMIVGGIIAVLVGLIFRHAGMVLIILVLWWTYGRLTSDPVRDHHQVELHNEEYERVKDQEHRITASEVQVTFERYGAREVAATIKNGSTARVSDVALRCSYIRPEEDDPWSVTTPVATTGFIQPKQSKRLTFALYGAASDAVPSSFDCIPKITLNDADLMKAGIVRPKNQIDKLIVATDIQVTARLGRIKIDTASVIAEGSITNRSDLALTKLSLTCSGIMNELGRVASISGGTSIYLAPGETRSFAFEVGKLRIEDARYGVEDLACRVLTLHPS